MVFSAYAISSDYEPQPGMTGGQIYTEKCMACHGASGEGKFGLFFNLLETELSMKDIQDKIQQGGSMMPAYPNIKGDELANLVIYVKALSVQKKLGKEVPFRVIRH